MRISFIKNLFFFFVLLVILFGSLFHYVLNNQDKIKSYVLESLQKSLSLDFSYSKEELSVFPFLGIRLINFKLNSKQNNFSSEISNLEIQISWIGFLTKSLTIESLKLESGYLNYTLEKKNPLQTIVCLSF